MIDCDFQNDAMTCPRCGYQAKARDVHRNCSAIKAANPSACLHRGKATGRVQTCETCQGNVRVKVFACELHGECTISRQVDSLPVCHTCPDWSASDPAG